MVAVKQIPARKPIEATDVTVREVPIDPTNAEGVFTDPTKVIGLIPGVSILEGQPIYANFLASQAQGGQFSILQPGETVAPDSETWRAVSLTVPDDRSVGGLVRPGDTVDVFVTTTITIPEDVALAGKYYTDKSTKLDLPGPGRAGQGGHLLCDQGPGRHRRGDQPPPGQRRCGLQLRPASGPTTPDRSTRPSWARRPT